MRRLMFRCLAIFLALVGLFFLVFPFAALFMPGGSMLALDTFAYLGAGTEAPVPHVSEVDCSAREYGLSIRTSGRLRVWECDLFLDEAAPVAPAAIPADRYAGMDRTGANAEFQKAISALATPDLRVQSGPSTLERELPFDRSGAMPTLRRMSGMGEPPRYGVIWGGRELASHWFMWGLMSLLMSAFGAAAIYAARIGWHRR